VVWLSAAGREEGSMRAAVSGASSVEGEEYVLEGEEDFLHRIPIHPLKHADVKPFSLDPT
jgi:hypothetical protein